MTDITVMLPDESKHQHPKGCTGLDIARSIGPRLAKDALAIKVNGELVDVWKPINEDAKIEVVTFKSPEGKDVFRHSTAHVFAYAIQELYPEAKNTIGPAVEEGFYYDFDDLPITEADFPKIEARMKEIVARDERCLRHELTLDEVKQKFLHNKYKVEMASEFALAGGKLSAYQIGEKFMDLCRGPHVPSTGCIKAFKLTMVAKAYWRGDAKNRQLTRVYGISFPSQKELDEYIKQREEAEKRDHRRIGRELDLFMMHEFSPGSAFFFANGVVMFNELVSFLRDEYFQRGYEEVMTPVVFDKQLWELSGHWEHYRQNMFLTTVEGREFSLKPMNCPSHALMFKAHAHSYRELPIRMADFGVLHRNELSGVLGGLTRVRKLTQDDAHLYCRLDQVEEEINGILDLLKKLYVDTFGFTYRMELSTRPDSFLGDVKVWDQAEVTLQKVLEKNKIEYRINPGDGAFYGPKIDVHVRDSIGRSWQLATVQLDFNQAERFDLLYEGQDGKKHRPVVIHRAILGSLERFIGILIEHFAGKFPLWISPRQVKVLSVSEKTAHYADEIVRILREDRVRAQTDTRAETIGKKIREAQLEQWNYIIVVGDQEVANKSVNVRTRDNVIHGEWKIEQLLKTLRAEIDGRK
ncbi:threonine--tRNA ligase [Candidatus Woesearchaeota archaeon]|nr:threonine--tRNA ligase [Candidatus Woesearchaeota archaeon]